MNGVSFDFSRKSTGVVRWNEQEPVETTIWSLPNTYLGEQLSELECALTLEVDGKDVHWLAYEHASVTSFGHASIQLAMVGILHKVAYEYDITILGLHPATIKKVLTGSGRAKKPEMVAAARERYPHLDIPNDDVADALAVGLAFFEKVELTPS